MRLADSPRSHDDRSLAARRAPAIARDTASSTNPRLSSSGTATACTTENAEAELLDKSGSKVVEDTVAEKPNRKLGRMSAGIDTTTSKTAADSAGIDVIAHEIGPRPPTAGVVQEAVGPDV
jgi:hypothetical protein